MIDIEGLLTLRKLHMTSDLYNIIVRWDGHLYDLMTYNFLCSYCCSTDFSWLFRHRHFLLFFRKATGLKDLDIEPWMVGLYTEGSRPIQATGLLEEASYRVLGQKHALSVRDSLCLQLVLLNGKRGGDITHIRAEDLDRVEIKEGYWELMVSMQC